MLGARIKLLREELGLKQEDLAKKLSVSTSAIGMYERDLREPNNELTLKMLKGEHDLEIVFKDIDATGIIQNLHLSINKSDTVTYIAMAVVVILLILSIGMISKPLLNRYKGGKKR